MAKETAFSRRSFLKTLGTLSSGIGIAPAVIIPGRAQADQKTLRILQWNHFIPEFDVWFNQVYVKEWGEKNNTRVIVDNVGMTSLHSRAAAEISAQRGHDIFFFLSPPAIYEDHVIDHREIYEECESKYGKPLEIAEKSTYNIKTRKYYGFSDSYVPDPINYRKDLWDDVGIYPDTWEDIRIGGRKIKDKHGIPIGLGLAPELDTNMVLRSIMASFGASVQDTEGRLILKSKQTIEAMKFVKALYRETMTDEVFAWDASSNNRMMLAGRGSLTANAISITRRGESQKIPLADRIWLAKAAKGPVHRIGLNHLMDAYVIWKFAENIEGAKQFLVDYVAQSREVFLKSQFYNFPCYPKAVPDIDQLISHDNQATPPDKYAIFKDVSEWTVNVGFPGYANAATDEIFSKWILPKMFAQASSGKVTLEDALDQGYKEIEPIYQAWSAQGKI
ncbi:MAG: carbohydrate ABC transporter substrate-binding protein [Anaerolineae bacterium]|jgi:multiple sugar transport system substrate-binding protein|nr:carbohydrate ABC transporter substrate-binding protein [Anaerolineae bacterium]MBT7710362.1 carbohydrate ABC transporter substrate-binding protein [Deltaproteobacteria bacterium]